MGYLSIFDDLLTKNPCLVPCREDILQAYDILKRVYSNGGKVLLCGNGGSAADCEHMVGELMKGFERKRPVPDDFRLKLNEVGAYEIADHLQSALPAISLVSQTSLISAFSNDVGYEYASAQQVYGYGRRGDALIAISTSGAADNVLIACYVAKAIGMDVIGLTGETGGKLLALCDACICVPLEDTAAVQEKHMPVYHAICAALEDEFFGGK